MSLDLPFPLDYSYSRQTTFIPGKVFLGLPVSIQRSFFRYTSNQHKAKCLMAFRLGGGEANTFRQPLWPPPVVQTHADIKSFCSGKQPLCNVPVSLELMATLHPISKFGLLPPVILSASISQFIRSISTSYFIQLPSTSQFILLVEWVRTTSNSSFPFTLPSGRKRW